MIGSIFMKAAKPTLHSQALEEAMSTSETSKHENKNEDTQQEQQQQQQLEEDDENHISKVKFTKKIIKQIQEENTEAALDNDILKAESALELFLDSKFNEAETLLKPKYGKSLYLTLGYAVIRQLKAFMTFDPEDITIAIDALRTTQDIAGFIRNKTNDLTTSPTSTSSSNNNNNNDTSQSEQQSRPSTVSKRWTLSGMFAGAFTKAKSSTEGEYLRNMSRPQRHAELVGAEAQVMRACLAIVTQTNLVSFVKESLAIRSSYNTIKNAYKFTERVYDEEGVDGFSRLGLDEHFVCGILAVCGCFNLSLSLLPAKALKILELIGFSGDREFALSRLETAARWPTHTSSLSRIVDQNAKKCFPMPEQNCKSGGIYKPMADLILLTYHTVLSTFIPLPDCDLPLAKQILDQQLETHPNSFIFLAIRGRMSQTMAETVKALSVYESVMTIQKDWRQLIHVCMWDIAMLKGIQGHWKEASEIYDVLFQESKWSKAIYRYLQAVCLYMHNDPKDKEQIAVMLKELPRLTKKIAGKSIPLEKFVCRKARKFFNQGERLLLPPYELYYFFNGMSIMDKNCLDLALTCIDDAIKSLEALDSSSSDSKRLPYSTYYDDLVLARFLKALAEREKAFPGCQTLIGLSDQVLQGRAFGQALDGDDDPLDGERKYTPTRSQISGLKYSQRNFEAVMRQSSEIELDHWMLPFARYEMGHFYMRCGKYVEARKEFQAAINNGNSGEDDIEIGLGDNIKASMDASVNLRTHNAVIKLTALEKMAAIV